MPTFAYILGLGFLMIGLILLKLGLWPSRRGDTPYCRKCGYNLTGLPSDRCPECGTTVSAATTIRGERHRRPVKIILAILVLALSASSAVAPLDKVDIWPRLPTFVVAWYLDSTNPKTSNRAWQEMAQRLVAGQLSAAQSARLFDRATQFKLYVRRSIRPGDPLPFFLENTARQPFSTSLEVLESIALTDVTIDGQAVRAGTPMSGIHLGEARTEAVLRPTVGPGTHVLRVRGEIARHDIAMPSRRTIVYDGPILPGKLLDRRGLTLEGRFEVLTESTDEDITLVDRPELTKDLRKRIRISRITLDAGSRQLRAELSADCSVPLQVGVAADVLMKVGDKEYPLAVIVFSRQSISHPWARTYTNYVMRANGSKYPLRHASVGRQSISTEGFFGMTDYDGPPVTLADVIVRPDKELARQTQDLFAIWGGELVYKEVPVEVVDGKPTTRPATATAPS